MSGLEYDYDDVLRRALHSAAESIEPSPDGLERIRERLAPPPLYSFAMISDWYAETTRRFVSWAEPVIDSMLDIFWATVDRFRPEEPSGHARSRYGWLRPAAAMGTAIFVIAAGILAVMTLPQAISSTGSISLPWTQHAATGSSAQAAAHSASHLAKGGHSGGPSGTAAGSPAASSRCSSPGATPSGSASPSPSTSGSSTPPSTASTSPSITPTGSPTPTTDPSPSVTDTSTSDPGSEGTPTPSASSPGTDGADSITAGLSSTLNVVRPVTGVSLAAVLDTPGATHTPSTSKSPSPKKSTTCAPR